MADAEQIVRDIIEVMTADGDPTLEKVATLATQYRDEVQACNDRLYRCDELLRKGFRAESIQQSKSEPNLLELVTVLDFTGRDEWNLFVAEYDLPTAPELLIDVASELNEAFVAEEGLAGLMRRHRLHALARSSLPTRIAVMRRISRMDKDNPIWEADIREFEKRRHLELGEEVLAASKSENLPRLAAIEQEIRNGGWLERPPKTLVERATSMHAELRVKKARADLHRLEPKLTAAFSSLEVGTARILRQRWNALAGICNPSANDPLVEMVAPALEWLENEDRRESDEAQYNATLAELQEALDDNASREDIERLYHTLARHERGVSELLHQRVAERLEYLDVSEARRGHQVLVGIVMAVLLIAGLTGWGIVRHLAASRIDQHVQSMEKLLADGNLAGASEYYDQLKQAQDEAVGDPSIEKLKQDLDARINKEEGRKARLAQLLASANDAAGESATWTSIENAMTTLSQAEDLTSDERERSAVFDARKRVGNKRRELQQAVDSEFTSQLDSARRKAKDISDDEPKKLDALLSEVRPLERTPRVSEELLQQSSALTSILRSRLKAAYRRQDEAIFTNRITEAVGNRRRFVEAIKAYVAKFPAQLRSKQFTQRYETEEVWWKRLEDWNRLIVRNADRDLALPQNASKLAADIATLREEDPKFPLATRFDALLDTLLPIQNRFKTGEDGKPVPITNDLEDALNRPIVYGLYVIREKTGEMYYSRRKPVPTGMGYVTTWLPDITNFDNDRRQTFLQKNVEVPTTEDGWVAPQSAFAKEALAMLDALERSRFRDWEKHFGAMLEQLYENKRGMEPILRIQLVLIVTRIACQGSHLLQAHYKDDLDLVSVAINDVDIDANWLDPRSPEVGPARRKASDVLRRLRAPTISLDAVGAELKKRQAATLGTRYEWVGWLQRRETDTAADWVCAGNKIPEDPPSAKLVILYPDADGASAKLEEIGSLNAGKVVFRDGVEHLFAEGRPVYVVRTTE